MSPYTYAFMESLKPVLELLRDWLPFLITLLIAILLIGAAYHFLIKRRAPSGSTRRASGPRS